MSKKLQMRMGSVTANHDTENRSNDLPIYLVLYESLTMLEKKVCGGGR